MDLDTLKGTVQGYFDRAFVEVAEKVYETPLANSDYGFFDWITPAVSCTFSNLNFCCCIFCNTYVN